MPWRVLSLWLLLPLTMAASASVDIGRQIDAGHCREALQALQPLLEARPHDAHLLTLRGRAQLAMHDTAAAVDSLRAAAKADPDDGDIQFWLGQALAKRIPEVSVLSRPALARELRDAYQAAVKLSPQSIEARESLMDFYLQAPGFFGGSVAKAREQAQAIASLDAARGARAQAVIAADQGHPATAIREYEKAIELKPQRADLRMQLGELYLNQGHPHEACELLRQALQLQPHSVETLEQLGAAALESGRRKDLQAGIDATRQLLDQPSQTATQSPAKLRARLKALQSALAPLPATSG